MKRYKFLTTVMASAMLLTVISCKKLIEIPEPVDSVTTVKVFDSDAVATAAILSVYSELMYGSGNQTFSSGGTTIYAGLAADELNPTGTGTNPIQFQTNNLLSDNTVINSQFWIRPYKGIYIANAVIEGLEDSDGVLPATKRQLMAEAKFLRAFCYFYLVNLFGDVPLVTSISWTSNYLMARSPADQVYEQIVSDLKDAAESLPDAYVRADNSLYPVAGAERTRVNRAVANAMLARVYLYQNRFDLAEVQASLLINNPNYYTLVADPNNIFKPNSTETIWQLQPNTTSSPYATREGELFIPSSGIPTYQLTASLATAFKAGDLRRNAWLDSVTIASVKYYYPKKYKVRQGMVNVAPTEYYTMLRLGEQYLIRAEARARQNKLTDAIADLNALRSRSRAVPSLNVPNPLPALSASLDQNQVLAAVASERQVELAFEWGHRWFDLKRTGQADAVLSALKNTWQGTAKLWPIPLSELQRDPNLVQNPGYQ